MKSGPSKDKPLEVRPCCIKCRKQMSRNRDTFRCRSCPRWGCKAHSISRVNSSNPYCLHCRQQMCYARPSPDKLVFQCTKCRRTVTARSTYHGRLSTLPFCIHCRRMMYRTRGTALPGGSDTGGFRCGNCKAYTLENPVRYKPRPSWRAARIMRLVDDVLPNHLDVETRQELRAALLCDLLSGKIKQSWLGAKTVRRYMSNARVSSYADVRLDAVLPSGNRLIDLFVG